MKRRAIAFWFAAALVLGLGGLALAQFRADHSARYADVVSIADAPSYQDPALLARAWALPVAALYHHGGYEYQSNPSFCGPASAANLLRSQGVAATQRAVLAGTNLRPVFGLLVSGLTLDEEAQVLRAAGQNVTVLRDLTLEEFRAQVARANDATVRYIINFHRGPLWGSGHGHFSPILAYLAAEDLVFVGDVNAHFQPFLAPTARLYEAMDTTDSDSNLKRGLLLVEISSPPQRAP